MADLVESVLESVVKKQSKYKTTEVKKDVDLEIDLGNLVAGDSNLIDLKNLRSKKEEYLKDVARDNVQVLINKIWELPAEKVENVIVAKLPEPTTLLPREKRIPKKKTLSKWEEYAKTKGIQKKKRGTKVWDDELKQWIPRWGYKSKNDTKKDWVLEVPNNADPYEDQFEKKSKEKKERVAKNELQRLRNIARNSKKKVPGVGLTPAETQDKHYLAKALSAAQKSDASLGRFSKKIPKEDEKAAKQGKKRKFESNTGNMGQEKKRALNVLNNVLSHNPIVDKNKAANLEINEEQRQRSKKNKSEKKSGKSSSQKGKNRSGPGSGGKSKGQKRESFKAGKGKNRGKRKGKG